jgi:beta-glucosidase
MTSTRPETAAATAVVARLTRDQKIAMLSGADFWNTKGLPGHGVQAVMVTDGPHGLRKQRGNNDHVGLGDSVPATCFPTAAALGSTWDAPLLEQVGAALGREVRAEHVAVLLGPGLNIKRHPAGGRNFEYFSEDPLLAGKAAAALVRGIQSEGVGACLKHFAVNNQENNRMSLDTIVDERTLRELYLAGFETAVIESQPWTVMCAYNLVNGEHAGESRKLLTDILRDEWGFDGLVMSDWLAVADRPVGVHAGLDLEMPGSQGSWDGRVAKALDTGALSEADLDRAAARVIELALRAASGRREHGDVPVDFDAQHALARKAAAAGTVLLANPSAGSGQAPSAGSGQAPSAGSPSSSSGPGQAPSAGSPSSSSGPGQAGLLPLTASGTIGLIGAFAETPRYQGAGSSQVNPTRLDTALEVMRGRVGTEAELVYAPGYDARTGASTAAQLEEARAVASRADVVVLVVGLPASYESEGFDRDHLRLPQDMYALVNAVLTANSRTALVLVNGAPVELDFAAKPAAVVEAYLGGQAGGSAIVDVLFGDAEPGGRLAESMPMKASDLPSDRNFASHPTQVRYLEGLNVGYRFHDTWDVAPRYPFGHGLSYTAFEWTKPEVTGSGTEFSVSVTVTNTGERAGSEVVQVYVHDVASTLFRPEQELRGFAKVHLEPGASERVTVPLGRRAFAVWDVAGKGWLVESGEFEVRIAASSRDVRFREVVTVASEDVVSPVPAAAGPVATEAEFEKILGRRLPMPRPLLPLTPDSGIDDLAQTWLGRRLHGVLMGQISKNFDLGEMDEQTATMMQSVIGQMPLRGIVVNSGGKLSFDTLDKLLAVLNLGKR